jgi:hypothetical protein
LARVELPEHLFSYDLAVRCYVGFDEFGDLPTQATRADPGRATIMPGEPKKNQNMWLT